MVFQMVTDTVGFVSNSMSMYKYYDFSRIFQKHCMLFLGGLKNTYSVPNPVNIFFFRENKSLYTKKVNKDICYRREYSLSLSLFLSLLLLLLLLRLLLFTYIHILYNIVQIYKHEIHGKH